MEVLKLALGFSSLNSLSFQPQQKRPFFLTAALGGQRVAMAGSLVQALLALLLASASLAFSSGHGERMGPVWSAPGPSPH